MRTAHGPLGALYPTQTWTAPNPHSTLKEGDTPSWFYFLPIGLSDPAHPGWGGWGGRFRHERDGLWRDAKDSVGETTDSRTTVWRWRPAFQADFQARMDWCVQSFADANHPPKPVINGAEGLGFLKLAAKVGSTIKLSADGSSDPDRDKLAHRWWIYGDADSYGGRVQIDKPEAQEASLAVPADAASKALHVILEVTDDGEPSLTRYRRVVIEVSQ